MAHNASRAAHRHHGVLRSIGAVFLGLAVIFILSLGMDQLMHSLEIYPPWDQPMVDVEDGLLALGYRTPIAIFGCYLAARFAPRARWLTRWRSVASAWFFPHLVQSPCGRWACTGIRLR